MDYYYIKITNVEMALLEIVKEKNGVSGYEIRKIIEERGYREWANIGKTSIYIGIKKLKKKGLITIKTMNKKEGKGPPPNKIKLTKLGEKVLVEQIGRALLSQKNLSLYYLGIAGIGLIKKDTVLELLKQRKKRVRTATSRSRRPHHSHLLQVEMEVLHLTLKQLHHQCVKSFVQLQTRKR